MRRWRGAGGEGRARGTPEAIRVRVPIVRQVFASGRARPGGVTAKPQPRMLGRGRVAPAPLGPQVGVGAPPAPRGSVSRPLAAVSPGPRWGAGSPGASAERLPASDGPRAPRMRRGGCPVRRPRGRVRASRPLCTACVHRSWARGRGYFAFCKIIS